MHCWSRLSPSQAVDKLCIQALNELTNAGEASWNEFDLHWSTQLSNGKEIDLKPHGRTILVPFADRAEYVRLTIHHRLTESESQVAAIRKGLHQVVPAHLLSLFSFHDLEVMTVGHPEVHLEVLRKHTIYRGVTETAPLIGWLWKALESFTTEERQLFLRFGTTHLAMTQTPTDRPSRTTAPMSAAGPLLTFVCCVLLVFGCGPVWGRSRLPISESDWTSEMTVHQLKEADETKLPISHCCFFSIELPAYQSYEQLRTKLLYAIVNCIAIGEWRRGWMAEQTS
jgi:hypothetical protein